MKIYKWGFQPGVNDWIDLKNTMFSTKEPGKPGTDIICKRTNTSKNVGKKIRNFL